MLLGLQESAALLKHAENASSAAPGVLVVVGGTGHAPHVHAHPSSASAASSSTTLLCRPHTSSSSCNNSTSGCSSS